jgi:hypothetical protein
MRPLNPPLPPEKKERSDAQASRSARRFRQSCSDPCLAANAGIDEPLSPECYDCTVIHCGDPLRDPHDGGALAACTNGTQCQQLCSEPDWSCLGHVEWPTPTPAMLSLPVDYRVQAFGSNPFAPISGGTVKLCDGYILHCDQPLAGPVTTDSVGNVTVTVENSRTGADRSFRLRGIRRQRIHA